MMIYIDVGHGGAETSTVAQYPGYTLIERDVNLVIASELQKAFAQRLPDVETLMSRLSNDGSAQWDAIGINASATRCALWSEQTGNPVDVMLSVHCNGGPGGPGYQVIHSVQQPAALPFAIAKEWDSLGHHRSAIYSRQYSGGIWTSREDQLRAPTDEPDYYGIIRQTIRPATQAIILEFCFLDNQADVEQWIWDPGKGEYRMDKIRDLVVAVIKAIAKHFGLTMKDPVPVPIPEPVPEPKLVFAIRSLAVSVLGTGGDMANIEIVINSHHRTVAIPIKEG